MLRYFPITGRLIMTDDPAAAHVILDTDDDMLCVKPADVEVGSLVVPARTAYSSGADGTQIPVDVQEDYYIATLEVPGANVVRGMMRVTWASNPEPADNLWRQASGTHIDILDGVSQTMVPQSDLGGYDRVATLGGYTFFVNDLGHLMMRERIVMRARDPGGPPASYNRARQQATVAFRLLVGFFLNQDFTPSAGVQFCSINLMNLAITTLLSNAKIGYAFAGRRIVIAVATATQNGGTGKAPIEIKVNGVAATMHDTAGGGAGFECAVAVASILLETGTTANFQLNFSGDPPPGAVVYIYAAKTVLSSVPTTTKATASSASSAVASVNVGPGEMALVIGATFTNGVPDPTLVNATADASGFSGTVTRCVAGHVARNAGAQSVSVQQSGGTGDCAIIVAKFK